MEKAQMRETIAKRVAKELKDGDVVNLGIGLPTMVPNYLPKDVHVILQTENGMIGMGSTPAEGEEDVNLINSGGGFITAQPGAVSFSSADSFCMVRGGTSTKPSSVLCKWQKMVTLPTGWFQERWLLVWVAQWTLCKPRRLS